MGMKWKAGLALAGLLTALTQAQAAAIETNLLSFCIRENASRDQIVGEAPCALPTDTLVYLPYVRSQSLGNLGSTNLKDITKLVIVVHGNGGDPRSVYGPLEADWLKLTTTEKGKVLLIAPQFLNTDQVSDSTAANILRWAGKKEETDGITEEERGWFLGGSSMDYLNTQVSSFDIMDAIIHKVALRASKLSEVVVAGHSAGGQFVNRYTIGTKIEDWYLTRPTKINFRYVVANARSYMYFSEARYKGTGHLVPPPADASAISACPLYDQYRYGIHGVPANHYMNTVGTSGFLQNAVPKNRLFIIGEDDVVQVDPVVPENCAINLQGPNRFYRMMNYMHHLKEVGAAANASFCMVRHMAPDQPGDGHAPQVFGKAAFMYFWKLNQVNCGYFTNPDNTSKLGNQTEDGTPAGEIW